MNVFCFTGNLGSDAEIRMTPNGKSVTQFNVACTSGWGDNKTTSWMRCSMWGDRGEKVAPFLLKGGMVAISGEFTAREWEDKDGNKRISCDVRVNDLTLCGTRDAQRPAQQAPQQAPAGQTAQAGGSFDDDIPFAPFDY